MQAPVMLRDPWTEFEKELPVFYREALARLLCLEHFRNLIETQALDAGTTVYTDHATSTYVGSLSNKERLSTWRIHETSDLTGIVQALYKAGQHLGPGPYGGLADPLSRMPRGAVSSSRTSSSPGRVVAAPS